MSADFDTVQGFVGSLAQGIGVQADPVSVILIQVVGVAMLVLITFFLGWTICARLRDVVQPALSPDLTDLKRSIRKTEADYEEGRRELSR